MLLDPVVDNERNVSKAEKQGPSRRSDSRRGTSGARSGRARDTSSCLALKDAHVDAALGDQDPAGGADADAGDRREQFD